MKIGLDEINIDKLQKRTRKRKKKEMTRKRKRHLVRQAREERRKKERGRKWKMKASVKHGTIAPIKQR